MSILNRINIITERSGSNNNIIIIIGSSIIVINSVSNNVVIYTMNSSNFSNSMNDLSSSHETLSCQHLHLHLHLHLLELYLFSCSLLKSIRKKGAFTAPSYYQNIFLMYLHYLTSISYINVTGGYIPQRTTLHNIHHLLHITIVGLKSDKICYLFVHL